MKRKFFAAVLSAVLTISSAVPFLQNATANAAENKKGDLNADGVVDLNDILIIQNYLAGKNELSILQKKFADITGDGKVNIFDLSVMKSETEKSTPLYKNLVINEVCSTNKGSVTDSGGRTPDWVEIYNPNEKAVSLSEIGLSDSSKNKFKFTFPDNAIIPANGYILVYCDDALYSGEGEYHAAFKISAAGETIYLTHSVTGEIDSVAVPELKADITYGRYENGSKNFTYLTPTPAQSNDSASKADLVEKPVFSVDGGFYDASFKLSISDNNGNIVYYTTDGSDPRTSSTAKIFDSTIEIYNNTNEPNLWSALADITLDNYSGPNGYVDKGIVVRAASKTSDGSFSSVVTNSYFVGKTASYYSDMKVLSLVTDPDNLFDDDKGAYMVGNGFYEWKNSSSYIKYENGDTNNPTNYNKDGKESEFPVNIQVFENGKPAYSSDVGARISGAWSRSFPQKSIRLYARSEYGGSKMKYAFIDELKDKNGKPIKEFDKVTIRNGGTDNQLLHFRDMFIQDLCSDRSTDIQGGEPCVMFIDGEFWGFYFIREKLDSDYVESHYGINKNNVTVIKNCDLDEGSRALANQYYNFLLWGADADMTDPANYQRVCDTIDIKSFIDLIVIETYVNNADWATGWLNNFILWRSNTIDPNVYGADGKWRFTLYDLDYSADYFHDGKTLSGFDSLNSLYRKNGSYNMIPLFYNLLNNEQFNREFYDTYIEIIKNNFSPETVNAKIDEYAAAYEAATRATNTRFGVEWANYNYKSEIQNLKNFFNERYVYAKRYLDVLYKKASAVDGESIKFDPSRFTYYGDASHSYDKAENSYYIETKSIGANEWDIQTQTTKFSITNGKTYRVSFKASCDSQCSFSATINHQSGTSWPSCWSSGNIDLKSSMSEYSYTFTSSSETASNWQLCFNFGNGIGKYTIKDVEITEVVYCDNLVNELGSWSMYNPSGSAEIIQNDIDAVTVNTAVLPENSWEAQALYHGIVLKAGASYTYSFKISSDVNTSVQIHVQKNYDDYEKYDDHKIEVSSIPKTCTYTFTADSDCIDASICFDCGFNKGIYEISDVSVVRNT